MKKKNVFRVAALLAVASVGFAGCSKDDDAPASSSVTGPIKEAVATNGVTVDRVEVYPEDWGKPDVEWKDGSLTVTLPETVTNGLETPYKNLPSGLSVSNSEVKGVSWEPRISAFNGNEEVGYFYYATAPYTGDGNDIDYSKDGTYKEKIEEVGFVYVDGDVIGTGSYTEENAEDGYPVTESITVNLSFKKGWNIQSTSGTYEITIEGGKPVSIKVTATMSSSANGAKWYFYDSKKQSGTSGKNKQIEKIIQVVQIIKKGRLNFKC